MSSPSGRHYENVLAHRNMHGTAGTNGSSIDLKRVFISGYYSKKKNKTGNAHT
jgi:hypothetical protein